MIALTKPGIPQNEVKGPTCMASGWIPTLTCRGERDKSSMFVQSEK
jgi:hypothetical protein